MIYLASPYSHEDPAVVMRRFIQTERATAIWLKEGHPVFSPIVMTHQISYKYDMPKEAGPFWWEHNQKWLAASERLWMLQLGGWMDSKGMKMEFEYAAHLGIPIHMKKMPA